MDHIHSLVINCDSLPNKFIILHLLLHNSRKISIINQLGCFMNDEAQVLTSSFLASTSYKIKADIFP